ncbi:MAG: hypothetical protein HY579_05755 [Nitrospinae bacterium]|nr:hypothetical protein [Nitrospinota bacterium]
METGTKITAVCGWAISPEWFGGKVAEFFPSARVRVVYPLRPADREEAEKLLAGAPADLYIGYSLGSLWLLHHRERLPSGARKALLAPILAFPRERKSGGKTSIVQLKYLMRELERRPGDSFVLKDFYVRCGLSNDDPSLPGLPDRQTLVRGLEFLSQIEEPGSSASGFIAVLGDKDNLLDSGEMKRHLPHLEIAPSAGHAPEPLLERLAELLR